MRRRTILVGAPTAVLTIATRPASADFPSHLTRLFAEYSELNECMAVRDLSPAEAEAAWARMVEIEDCMMPISPVTVEEFAIKLVVATGFGDFMLEGRGVAPLHDAKAILQYWPPNTPLEPLPCAG